MCHLPNHLQRSDYTNSFQTGGFVSDHFHLFVLDPFILGLRTKKVMPIIIGYYRFMMI